jgi:hypothetical protein
MFLSRGILLIISIFCFTSLFAQDKYDQYYDIRVKKQFDSLDINYSITKLNNFKINLITKDSTQKRTQIVIINSKIHKYDNYETREIESLSFKFLKKEGKMSLYEELLKENALLKIGQWSLVEFKDSPDTYSVLFSVKVSPYISADDLYSIVFLVGNAADRIEKKYMKGADEN